MSLSEIDATYQQIAQSVLATYRQIAAEYWENRETGAHRDADIIGADYLDRLADAVKALLCDAECADLDRWFPYTGPCGCCEHPDARHRLFDAILTRHVDGRESIADLAADYDKPIAAIVAVLRDRPYRG